jgi:hypothetical protein
MPKKNLSAIFLGIALLLFTLNSCKIGRFVAYNFADITDYKIFPARTLQASATPFLFHKAIKEKVPKELTINNVAYPFENIWKTMPPWPF